MSKKEQDVVSALLDAAKGANGSTEALHYTQAALNAANARVVQLQTQIEFLKSGISPATRDQIL